MDLDGFRLALTNLAPALRAWGQYVEQKIKELSQSNDITPQMVGSRLKDVNSAVGKLSRKGYTNPLVDMTDLVGVRVVCLLSPDIKKLGDLVLADDCWNALLARDPAQEIEQIPEQFGYQSLHYEIRSKCDFQLGGITVPSGTCCELQIRTLMQHAFAEVVHDNIYKCSWGAPSKARRFVSSSAALIETADHLFCETMSLLESENQARGELLQRLTVIYDSKISPSNGKDKKFNRIVIDEFSQWINEETPNNIEKLLNNKAFIAERVRSRVNSDSFWSQPVSLLAYWLAAEIPNEAQEHWPFAESRDALNLVFSDLGKSFNQH
jgi:ppGpp synthetase/RelA/SpoT-type nucleotidyltranferase